MCKFFIFYPKFINPVRRNHTKTVYKSATYFIKKTSRKMSEQGGWNVYELNNHKKTQAQTYKHQITLPRVVVGENVDAFTARPLRCLLFPNGDCVLAACKETQRRVETQRIDGYIFRSTSSLVLCERCIIVNIKAQHVIEVEDLYSGGLKRFSEKNCFKNIFSVRYPLSNAIFRLAGALLSRITQIFSKAVKRSPSSFKYL